MDFNDAVLDICKTYPGLNTMDVRAAVDLESKDAEQSFGGRFKYERSLETAHARILHWLETGDGEVVELNYASLAHFAISHRPAYTWAVLAGRALRESIPGEMSNDE